VASYKAEPCALGPHYRMLIAVLQSNYFAKFMRTPQGSELYAFFVDNIITSVRLSSAFLFIFYIGTREVFLI
jgi:hypothetical protein